MKYIVVCDRPNSATGKAYFEGCENGLPVSSPFRDDAQEMDGVNAIAALDFCDARFFGYRVEPVRAAA